MRSLLRPCGLVVSCLLGACTTTTQRTSFVNPPGLSKPSGFTHVVEVTPGRILYVAGQVARDADGNLVGKGDMRAQSEQVFRNIQTALGSRGATLADIVQLTAYVRDMSQLAAYREVRERVLGTNPRPASSLVGVAALASDDYLLEVEVVATLPH
ncbi:MAG TPA: RidA family protein [Myxococcaceae bacterium]|nr:RidA family protein [Myxococcaceae bacterium]